MRTGYDLHEGAEILAERVGFPHPETGELLVTLDDFRVALREIEERMAPLYRTRRSIREEMSERFTVELPPARSRTPTQEKVARCPRCGGNYREEE